MEQESKPFFKYTPSTRQRSRRIIESSAVTSSSEKEELTGLESSIPTISTRQRLIPGESEVSEKQKETTTLPREVPPSQTTTSSLQSKIYSPIKLTVAIAPYLDQIYRVIVSNDTCYFNASTGSGKSIGIPWIIANPPNIEGFTLSNRNRVFISVPTISTALSLSKYQKKLIPLNDEGKPSYSVGYAAEGEIAYNDSTTIVYCTSGHLRRKIVHTCFGDNGEILPWNFCEVFILDEAHVQSLDNEMLYGLHYYSSRSSVKVPRLVLTSATISSENMRGMAGIQNIIISHYHVDEVYSNDYEVGDEKLYEDIANITIAQYKSGLLGGHILIFVPGIYEIELVRKKLSSGGITNIISAYSGMPQEDLDRLFDERKGERKVIVGTNFAETSITIRNISCVFDSMRENRSYEGTSGALKLTTSFITKSSAEQRKGRTGRTMNGLCLRMMSRETYDTLDYNYPPDSDRIPIYVPILELVAKRIKPRNVFLYLSQEKLVRTEELLENLEMIKDNIVTNLGKFVLSITLGIRNAKALYDWIRRGLDIYEGIVAICLIDGFGPSYYKIPKFPSQEDREKYMRKFDNIRGDTDIHSLLNLWSSFVTDTKYDPTKQTSLFPAELKAQGDRINQWINTKYLVRREFMIMLKKMEKVCDVLRSYRIKQHNINVENVVEMLRRILPECYSSLVVTHKGKRVYTFNAKDRFYLDTIHSVNRYEDNLPDMLIALSIHEPEKGFPVIQLSLNLPTFADDTRERKTERFSNPNLLAKNLKKLSLKE